MKMFWAKRRFNYAEYAPYMERLEKLMMANPSQYEQFIMVSTYVKRPGLSEYYVGVPSEAFLALFDGFEPVAESDLPKVVDSVHITAAGEEFNKRFRMGAT
jgi:hypothetical protein